jgi:probable phosphoglycerate mutase
MWLNGATFLKGFFMKSLFVVTHPEATHHLDKLVGGWFNSDLTAKGIERAKHIAQSFSNTEQVNKIYSSDLNRCQQTATEINTVTGAPVITSHSLREMCFGEAEGKPNSWLNENMIPANEQDRLNHKIIATAESRLELATRVYQFLDSLALEETQVIVSHGFASTFIIAWWIKMPLSSIGYVDFKLNSGSVTHLKEDDLFNNRSIVYLNKHSK